METIITNSISETNKTILIMAAGTGGHIFPGLAIANQLRNKGFNVVWLGTTKGMENQIVPKHQFPMELIEMTGLRNKGLKRLFMLPVQLIKSMLQTYKIINRINPSLSIGMGGYVSAPGGLVSWLTRTPLLIHEQNSRAGLSNKLLNIFANKTLCAFPNVIKEFYRQANIKLTGNPVRKEISTIKTAKAVKENLNILVLGGSLGAQQLNTIVPKAINQFSQQSKIYKQINIKHQTGRNKSSTDVGSESSKLDYHFVEFIDDMAEAYEWADIAICRAGALTVSEIAIAKLPAIFVPYPYAVDDHQTTNARYLVDNDAAYIQADKTLNEDELVNILEQLIPERIKTLQDNLGEIAKPNATSDVVNECLKLMHIETIPQNKENEVNHHA